MAFILATDFDFIAYMSKMAFFFLEAFFTRMAFLEYDMISTLSELMAELSGSILLWGHFPEEGIFPLELTWVQTPFPQKLLRMRV